MRKAITSTHVSKTQRTWRAYAFAGAVYSTLAVALTFPLVLHLSSVMPHDLGDPLLSTTILWWNAHVPWFTQRWWNGPAFFPAPGFLALSDPRLGESLIVSAQDSDGVIEAVEIPGDNFVLAVQWHPEERLDDLRLFAAVVEAAAVYAAGKWPLGGRSEVTRGKVRA